MSQYSHARNNHPAPPITIEVENGIVKTITFNSDGFQNYYIGKDINDLFEAAGVGPVELLFAPPPKRMPVVFKKMVIIPGTYKVKHVGNQIEIPEGACKYIFK